MKVIMCHSSKQKKKPPKTTDSSHSGEFIFRKAEQSSLTSDFVHITLPLHCHCLGLLSHEATNMHVGPVD